MTTPSRPRSTLRRLSSTSLVWALGAVCALAATSACKGGRGKRSTFARWVDKPTRGVSKDKLLEIPALGAKLEIPETLYVYKSCGEAPHSPEGENKWIPVFTCQSASSAAAADPFEDGGGMGGGEEGGEWQPSEPSEWGGGDEGEGAGSEAIALTFYVTHKARPLDERAVTWFEAQYKQAGLQVAEISYNPSYQKKAGIYAKLRVLDGENGTPTREIVQFMFPQDDVVFIARMDYPFGETRSVMADWQYLLWNFDVSAPVAK